jgi:hypothetical protein
VNTIEGLATCDECGQADDHIHEYVASCPACGSPIDYCQGHGEIGDPAGRAILDRHDDGDHSLCHPAGCDDAPLSGIVVKGSGTP